MNQVLVAICFALAETGGADVVIDLRVFIMELLLLLGHQVQLLQAVQAPEAAAVAGQNALYVMNSQVYRRTTSWC